MPTNLTGSAINVTFGQLMHVNGGPEATEKTLYSGTGVATAVKIGTVSTSVGNIRFSGNTIASTNTNGNINLTPNGTGLVSITNVAFVNQATARTALALGTIATQNADAVAITGGAISGVTFSGTFSGITSIDATTFTTSNAATGVTLTGNTLSADGTDANIDINITPKGTGEVNLTKVDIDAGSIDGTTVGATTPASVKGTTVEATTSIGYAVGTGGTVAQATSRTTGVTLNKITGEITLFAGTLAGHDADEFTLTNSTIGANDVIVLSIKSGCAAGTRRYYQVHVVSQAAGSCVVSVGNIDNATVPSTGTDSPVLQFAVIKGAIA
jgi:hypothetical protein